jgi:hypothetical protein
LTAGEYEDSIPGNSTWSEGDWDCDGDFTTRDLVLAFSDVGFVAAAIHDTDILKRRFPLRFGRKDGMGSDVQNSFLTPESTGIQKSVPAITLS